MKKSSTWLAYPIREFMTRSPHTTKPDDTLATALEKMRVHGVRHLPVVEGEKLVGIVSERDIYFLETLAKVDPQQVAVSAAMTPDAYSVPPDTLLEEVATTMEHHKHGCAVITHHGKVLGIFTTVDALRVLVMLLRKR